MALYGNAGGALPDDSLDSFVFPRSPSTAASGNERVVALEHVMDGLAAATARAWHRNRDPIARRRIVARLSALPLQDALARGLDVQNDWYGMSTLERFRFGSVFERDRPTSIDWDAISVLDRLALDLRDGGAIEPDALGLTHLSFHAALNPVAFCPAAFSLSELLSVAAWLGLLCRGRRVVMPTFVASYWQTVLGVDGDIPEQDWAPDAFLVRQAVAAVGLPALRRISQAVLKSGPTSLQRSRTIADSFASPRRTSLLRFAPRAFPR